MVSAILASALIAFTGWINLDDAHRLGGRKFSEGYAQGKTVMVCKDGLPMDRMEAIWDSLKTRQFVLLGSFETVKPKVTFPMYRDAALKIGMPRLAKIYVVSPSGRVVYAGENEREATDYAVSTIAKWEFPADEVTWGKVMDWEIKNLPAHALLRYRLTAKDFPEAAKRFEAATRALGRLDGIEEVVKLLKISKNLSEFVPKDSKQRTSVVKRINATIKQYSHLKESPDPQLSHEVKNALADLAWCAAEI